MKNILLAALILVTGSSYGRSLKRATIRLQVATTSAMDLHHLPLGRRMATVISVDSFGDVEGSECTERTNFELGVGRLAYTNCGQNIHIDRLSRLEMRKLDSLINDARYGEIIYPNPGGIHCLAIPTHSSRYTADQGNILLSVGTSPCGFTTFNNSEPAKLLVASLKAYEVTYSEMLGANRN